MRLLLLGLFLALGLATVAAAEPRLRIGVEIADKPISFVDAAGQPAGFTAEMVAAMSLVGLGEVEIVAKHWTVLAAEFEAGRLDALANVARTADRVPDMEFSVTHATVHGIVYTRRDHPPIRTTADFRGKVVASLAGSIALSNAIAHDGWGGTIRSYPLPQAAMDAVQNGECDAILLTYGLEGKYITNTYNLRREFVDDIIHQFRFAVHKGDTSTLHRLNDALAIILHNGTFDRLYDQWIGPIEPHPIRLADLRPYAQYIALGLLAIIAIIAWQRHMLARVSRHAQALKESEQRFHGLVDSSFEGWVIHHDGTIVLANQSFASTFGYTSEELTGKSVLELATPESQPQLVNAMKTGATTAYEIVGRCKDGSLIPVELAGQPCMFNGRPARIAAVRDLRAQKQAAADQLVLRKLESTGILAGGLAHDFNNLLATMVLNVELAGLHPQNPAENLAYLDAVKTAATSAKTLTQQLITFAQGGAPFRQPTDLAPLLENAVATSLEGSAVRADIIVAPDLWRADIDSGQIASVLHNLLLNAREAMPTGGVVRIRVDNTVLRPGSTTTLLPGEYLQLAITDTGPGIPVDVLPKIFDPYFSTKRRGVQKGMGLGLTISHAIAHQHGGALTVESQLSVGTTFHLFLPATRLPGIAPSAPAALPAAVPTVGRILVMDDEASLREIVAHALEETGYTVTLASDGQTAVDRYREAHAAGTPYKLVLLDLTVRGGMGGLEALRTLREFDPAVKAVVMSGYSQEAVLRDYAKHGFRGALTKPFNLDTLYRVFSQAIAS